MHLVCSLQKDKSLGERFRKDEMEEEDGDDSHEEGMEDNFIDDADEDRKCKDSDDI